VMSHEMAAATRAELSVTHFRFFKVADEFLSLRDADVFCLPQEVGIHRTSRVGAAGTAVAVSHLHWRAGRLDFDGATEAVAFGCVGHVALPLPGQSVIVILVIKVCLDQSRVVGARSWA
jgi:hypothetical protein